MQENLHLLECKYWSYLVKYSVKVYNNQDSSLARSLARFKCWFSARSIRIKDVY